MNQQNADHARQSHARQSNARPALGLVLDCRDPERLAPFWESALGYVVAGTEGNYTLLTPTADRDAGSRFVLQRVPEDKLGKNRMHIDLHTPDIEGTAARLEALGGRRLAPGTMSEFGETWILMADPEGNEFCICDPDNC